jgi:hypothetical protein
VLVDGEVGGLRVILSMRTMITISDHRWVSPGRRKRRPAFSSGILEIDVGTLARLRAADRRICNQRSNFVRVPFGWNAFANVFQGSRHIGYRVLIKFGKHDPSLRTD